MRYQDLPASMRAQVDAKLGRPTKAEGAKRARPKPKGAALGGGVLVCHADGARFEKGWGVDLERHADETGHRRYDVPLEDYA